MAATTIDRTGISVTNDTGTPSAPNADGTLFQASWVTNFCNKIDGLISAAIEFGSTVKIDGRNTRDCFPMVNEGRLTLESGVPISSSDQSNKATIYWEPYVGNRIALYDGTKWIINTSGSNSISVPANANTVNDLFFYDSAGSVLSEFVAWTNDTTRATALTRQDGVLVKSGDATRRYIGTIRTNGTSGRTDDTEAKRWVWNMYNRARRSLRVVEATNSWTYNTASFQQANASAANQVDVVVGVAEALLDIRVLAEGAWSSSGTGVAVSIGEDGTTASASAIYGFPQALSTVFDLYAFLSKYPAVGRHYYTWLEKGPGSGTMTWYGDNGGVMQTGIFGWIEG